MFESLQEGIVVIQNESITFSNIIFDSIQSGSNQEILDQKIYKVYRNGDEEMEASIKASSKKSNLIVGKVFSLR
jgi:hypothetical protein